MKLHLEIVGVVILGLEVSWLLITIALRVNHWYNGQRDFSVRKSSTANAAFKVASHGKEIFIGDVMPMASRLHLLHHEEILLTDWFHDSSLLSFVGNLVSDG